MDIYFNGESSKMHSVFLYDIPKISTSNETYTSTSIAGKRGALISRKGAFDNITITCTFSVLNNKFILNLRDLKRWLRGTGELIISESSDCYYEVLMINVNDVERELTMFGKFTVDFVCFPYEFDLSGKNMADIIDGVIVNEFDDCMPEYKIKGEGVCTLSVNGNDVTANVGQNLTIDTRRMISYRDNGILENTRITGNYDDLYLKSGENKISITKGFELEVIAHWGWNA